MNGIEKFVSQLKLKKVYFKNISFVSEGLGAVDEGKVHFEFSTNNLKECQFDVNLSVEMIFSDSMSLNISIVGVFEVDSAEFIDKMIPNSIAILFPYLRAEISLLTCQPNMPPVLLPPININALLEHSRKKENTEK